MERSREALGGGGGLPPWLLESVSRDASEDHEGLPAKPHPRVAPEQVILAQLAALRRGDLQGAMAFNMSARCHAVSAFGKGWASRQARQCLRGVSRS